MFESVGSDIANVLTVALSVLGVLAFFLLVVVAKIVWRWLDW